MEEQVPHYFLINADETTSQAMKNITRNNGNVVFVIDHDQNLKGSITDGDIRRSILNGVNINDPVTNVMNHNPTTISNSADIQEVYDLFEKSEIAISHIPATNSEGKIVNIHQRDKLHYKLPKSVSELFSHKPLAKIAKHTLITGGAGYIGTHLARILLEKGNKVTILDKFVFGTNSVKNLKNNLKNNNSLRIIEGDVSNVADIMKAIDGVDSVVHLAEIVGDPACSVDPKTTQQVNFLSTSVLAQVCKYLHIPRFVYASSCSVYGASEGKSLLNERSKLNPVSLYARMKIESEKVLRNMMDDVFSPTILRFATVFGLSDRMRFDLVVNILSAKAATDGKITVFGGDQWRPLVHVEDVALAIVKTLESPLEKVRGEVFNVGSKENNHTINDIGVMVKDAFPEAELVIQEKDVDKRNYCVDFHKIESALGFKAQKSVRDGIKEIKQAFKDQKFTDYTKEEFSNVKTYSLREQ
ncbi:NAD-dependent epimerase/dehydratase family protein [archaeon]|jgi:nucleoside-diphosphate-sugar epimerase|nr:NAD-dependent epimerase/dehydratase family protein [archaeon]MBT6762376.1 NAD-dependent epimerase/dehydratase family protein [archaeon]